MADDNDAGDNSGVDAGDGTGAGEAGKTFSQADLDRIVADRVARERQKYADYGDLKKFKASAMTDAEKATAEAEQRGRSAARVEAAPRIVRAEFKAAAAGRVEKEALEGFLEYADLSKFVDADGEPDTKAIDAAVEKLGGAEKTTDFDGGARKTADKPTDMNALIRRQAGLG